jgi:hypothetical protein
MLVDGDWRGGPGEKGWGVAPPYGAYRGRYSDYDEGQLGQLGSGKLLGASGVALGGFFEEKPFSDDELEAGAESKRLAEQEPETETFPPT